MTLQKRYCTTGKTEEPAEPVLIGSGHTVESLPIFSRGKLLRPKSPTENNKPKNQENARGLEKGLTPKFWQGHALRMPFMHLLLVDVHVL